MKKGKLINSFQYAFFGLWMCVRDERNMRIHIGAAVVVCGMGLCYDISRQEWSVLLLTIGAVMSLEAVNTAVEKVVDLTTTEHHPLAKYAKDVAAGAVLLFAFIAVVIGILIFSPYVQQSF
ncbi:diacylglycerol kinase family protein [Ectobacillus antri]|jgi:undecaprenol kinase|uniref:Diacylglycerol kinase family protein n=1 Tax=Ectobacillus antri TaxID=2486280 RepID=A0ABT6H3T5_9BACI|nr:diacylglycerol kinase family protein [Ectobacillus antri]MDG4655494.1 diacylglycerol kinase family protein [Ectobacillus antri]MDG5753252.1 diacylglycerol kinase family protein [Ectobacillus antri]